MERSRAMYIKCEGEIFRVIGTPERFQESVKKYPEWVKMSSIPESISRDHLTFFTHYLHLKMMPAQRLLKEEELYYLGWEGVLDEL